ncbi:hypothetical protein Taro_011087 [Colocasia esculenta]|uniref:Uncharacterized protein n=1 Tax=Colocasia esculenta TaxID=4460 RepID=A0A843U5C9_COLES|nr:hypothetical protein [Colocasia esculenta]
MVVQLTKGKPHGHYALFGSLSTALSQNMQIPNGQRIGWKRLSHWFLPKKVLNIKRGTGHIHGNNRIYRYACTTIANRKKGTGTKGMHRSPAENDAAATAGGAVDDAGAERCSAGKGTGDELPDGERFLCASRKGASSFCRTEVLPRD